MSVLQKKIKKLPKLGGWEACNLYPGKNKAVRLRGGGEQKCWHSFNNLPSHSHKIHPHHPSLDQNWSSLKMTKCDFIISIQRHKTWKIAGTP